MIDHKAPYWCAKYERNCSLGRLLWVGSFLKLCKKEKCEENWSTFSNKYLTSYVLHQFSSNLLYKTVHMNGIKYANVQSSYKDTSH